MSDFFGGIPPPCLLISLFILFLLVVTFLLFNMFSLR